jgi:hypothetical protein
MKRQMDLVRGIALQLETSPPTGGKVTMPEVPGFTEREVGYHAYLMRQAGLVEAADGFLEDPKQYAYPIGLTWNGHEFLDASRDNTLWTKAKTNVIGPAGGVAFAVLLEWLKAEAKAKLGLPP